MNISVLFDTAIAKLEAQDTKAFNPNYGVGAYRYNGTSCLFGGMIDDALYKPEMDAHRDESGNVVKRAPSNESAILDAIRASTGVNLLDDLSAEDIETIHGIHEVEWQPGRSFKALLPAEVSAKIWPLEPVH
ncbi:hypothetical protein Q5Y75_06660 [Ruegeria sp. 2205SS24-7]|uniref:hypothetical protein n=1 Tax=Ruegeria discodermiae TaxID=3064389 RepID=UPI0027413B82|nr:hypothetical protein [Ruegeria sp. 2205SS24-7]MDP5216893.1 hypothetical protein [Ruegeria sp. 2205SS24-7]